MPASYAVFQFRNVMIRTVSSPDPELFFCVLHNANKKVFYQIFCFLLTVVTFTSVFKDKKSRFSSIFLMVMAGLRMAKTTYGSNGSQSGTLVSGNFMIYANKDCIS
jgi:hypothetical protein